MKIFAGKNWTERLINRWHARAALGALLRRADDRFLDDIGVEREDLRRAFGQWKGEGRDRHGRRLWRVSAPAPVGGSAVVLALSAIFARTPIRRPSHGRSTCSAR